LGSDWWLFASVVEPSAVLWVVVWLWKPLKGSTSVEVTVVPLPVVVLALPWPRPSGWRAVPLAVPVTLPSS
jgi:hypothetical protein